MRSTISITVRLGGMRPVFNQWWTVDWRVPSSRANADCDPAARTARASGESDWCSSAMGRDSDMSLGKSTGMPSFFSIDVPVEWASMSIGERIEERRKAVGIKSQAELARRAKVPQSTLNGLIREPYRWSPHLARIAHELHTTITYLLGEEATAPDIIPSLNFEERTSLELLQAASPSDRQLMVSVLRAINRPPSLPSEDALAAAFEGLLLASSRMAGAELARELARHLPLLLQVAGDAPVVQPTVEPAALDEAEEDSRDVRSERRQASRT